MLSEVLHGKRIKRLFFFFALNFFFHYCLSCDAHKVYGSEPGTDPDLALARYIGRLKPKYFSSQKTWESSKL